jgi:ribosomal protein S27AE
MAGTPMAAAGAADDWACGKCNNVNFARRFECNRCR